jgi:type II secretory pathway pseudopilin PulG
MRSALTLIELVVVCAIIAVLVGIVWVLMAPSREKARLTTCISNLKQIGLAYQLYRQDWEGIDPEKGRRLQWWELGLSKAGAIQFFALGYIKDERLLFCPNWRRDPLLDAGGPKLLTSYRTMYGPDEETLPHGRPFSVIIAEIPDFPIKLCPLHDINYLTYAHVDRLLGLNVVGEVKWYQDIIIRSIWFK